MIATTMPKKIAKNGSRGEKTDRRGERYTPITHQELVTAVERLGRYVGVMLETAEEMQSLGIESVIVDGRGTFFDAVDGVIKYAKEMKLRVGLAEAE